MPQFGVGELVHHVRYDYRGVIVKVDEECVASDAWYQKNQTQPNRQQPWYHVLVDGGAETYVAETSIEPGSITSGPSGTAARSKYRARPCTTVSTSFG